MPDPIQWEPCKALASTSLKCQQMVFTWDPMGQVSGFPNFYEDPVHGPTFFINRYQGVQSKGNTGIYAEVDGSVLWAMMLPDATSQSCRFQTDAATPTNRFVLKVSGEHADNGSGNVGVILAGLNEAPRVALRRPPLSIGAEWFASDSWVVELGGLGFTARPWDFNSFFKPGLSPPEPSTATSSHKLQVLGDSIFYTSEHSTDGSVSVWTPETGNRYLLREPGVNFDNFATDGKDMVWSRLEGLISTNPPYDYKKKELWTAPFTTKREDLEKTARRVTTARAAVSLRPWVLGCGVYRHLLQR
jgi:hypothetical protein